MALFQNLKVAAGVGATELSVVLDSAEQARGGLVTGRVQARGGELPQIAEVIEARVQEDWSEQRPHSVYRDGQHRTEYRTEHKTRVHSRVALAVNFSVPAGGAFEWPFHLSVPNGADVSRTWSIQTTMRVPGAADRHDSKTLRLYVSGAVLGLKNALCQIAPFEFNGTGPGYFDLCPPQSLKGELDGVKFMFPEAQMPGFLSGQLEINPQEKTLKDRMRAAVGKDRIRHPLQIPLAQLNPAQPAPELVAHLRSLLQPYLV